MVNNSNLPYQGGSVGEVCALPQWSTRDPAIIIPRKAPEKKRSTLTDESKRGFALSTRLKILYQLFPPLRSRLTSALAKLSGFVQTPKNYRTSITEQMAVKRCNARTRKQNDFNNQLSRSMPNKSPGLSHSPEVREPEHYVKFNPDDFLGGDRFC